MHRFPSLDHRSGFLLPIAAAALATVGTAQSPAPPADASALLEQLPTRILPNLGQWSSPELYRMQAGGLRVFLERQGWSFWLQEAPESSAGARPGRDGSIAAPPAPTRAVAVRMEFVGAGAPPAIPERPLSGVSSFLVGTDASRHRTGVQGCAAVRYESMYPGVDVRVREASGHFEYDLLLAPGAELSQVRVRVRGALSLAIDAEGSIVFKTALGDVRQPEPRTWTVDATGHERPVECRYQLLDGDTFGFVAPDRDPAQPLVVDPPLLYSTYISGSSDDEPSLIVEDTNGDILVVGITQSVDYPATVGALQSTLASGWDGFVIRIDPSQPPASQVLFSTYIGGNANDRVNGVRPLPGGMVAFCGATLSTNLPTTAGVFQPMYGGTQDGFLGVLDPTGANLLALTYVGGGGSDWLNSVHLAPNGDLLVVGNTRSPQFPTTANAFSTTYGGGPAVGQDIVVTRFDLNLTGLLYSTFLGGTGDEWGWGDDVDPSGALLIFGGTGSSDFPTTPGAYQRSYSGGLNWYSGDGFAVLLDDTLPPAQQLVYATYIGGRRDDTVFEARRGPTGDIVVCGTTQSIDFPTTAGAYQRSYQGGGGGTNTQLGDGFVTRLDPTRSGAAALVAGTYFGGTGNDQGLDCVVDSNGEVTLVGWTNVTAHLPTTPDAMRRFTRLNDGFIAHLSGDLTQLLYSSLVGGTNHDGAWLCARHADGVTSVAGATSSTDVPMMNAAQPTALGGTETFVSRFDLSHAGITRRGRPTAGSNGSPTVHALGDVTPGNASFGFACTRARANAIGVLVLAAQPAAGLPLFNARSYVDPTSILVAIAVSTNLAGEQISRLALPAAALPTLHVQYFWAEDPSTLTLSASDALQIN